MIYLDNASTTRLRPEARAAMQAAAFGNPSSIHAAGRAARKLVEDARETIAESYGGDPKGLVFTSCATEADNLAVLGVAEALRARGNHVIASAVEHPAVLEACAALSRIGYEISRAPVDEDGKIDLSVLERLVTPRTILISVMTGNNEVGTLQPIEAVAEIARARKIPFHTDAAQAAGKIPFRFTADLVTLSAHKMHGPRGAGALWIRPGTPIVPRQVGGGHEFELRAGTENVEAIAGFAEAVRAAEAERSEVVPLMERLRALLEEGLRAAAPMRVNGHPTERLPHILNVTFPGVDGEAMVVALDAEGMCVSSGSACASQSLIPSHVLKAMGRGDEETRASVRFSLGRDTTEEDIGAAVAAVPKLVARLRAISPVVRP